MQVLGLLGMYFDDLVVFVSNFLLLFRLALAVLCSGSLNDLENLCIKNLVILF